MKQELMKQAMNTLVAKAEETQKEKVLPAYKKLRGLDKNGKPMFVRVDSRIQTILDKAIYRNKNKNWDYVAVVSGYCGVGKSVFSQSIARYCDETFDESKICFTAEEFIKVSNEVEPYSAVILDESFQSLNTRVTMSPDFLKIVNHLQILRQKHLFIFLNLPNFFDLSKNIAIFRTNHLFVCYSDDEDNRGKVLAFGRNEKKNLYILGGKFLDYGRVHANIVGKFWRDDVIDENIYENLKFKHLKSQEVTTINKKGNLSRAKLIYYMKTELKMKVIEISNICSISPRAINQTLRELIEHVPGYEQEEGNKAN